VLRFRSRRIISLLMGLSFFAGSAEFVLAQETINYASISGRVTDPSGAVVAGAQVSARQVDTNLTSGALTEADGRFRFPYLRLGAYEVKVRKPGFAESVTSLNLTAGSAFELPVALTVARTRRM
jgi:hypothetical protein